MFHAQIHYLNANLSPTGTTLDKTFRDLGEFNSWYKVAKLDPYSVIEIRNFDPQKDNLKKQKYDAIIDKNTGIIV